MNIFNHCQNKILSLIKKNYSILGLDKNIKLDEITLEIPPDQFNADLSSNIAMILGKKFRLKPIELAKDIKNILSKNTDYFEKVEIAGPGFINLSLSKSLFYDFIIKVNKTNSNYGSSNKKGNINIEFVSANPTGPMHIGHCRGAVFGDVLSNLLKFQGNKVTKEFYVNDYGNQIDNFTKSIFYRMREIKFKEKFKGSSDLYSGEYIVTIADEILKKNKKISLDNYKKISNLIKKESIKISMKLIKSDLKLLGVFHDVFISESEIVKKDLVKKAVTKLKKQKYVKDGFLEKPKGEEGKNWKKQKRLIFKSTLFGDDTDRALQKDDGSWTYFANDIAYHSFKVSRKFDALINILGADHTGYIKRITSAVEALSKKNTKLNCKVCQLVKLYKNGQPFKMSKRSGEFISVSDLLKEVNKDAVRFMMLSRSNDVELDFDFDKVIEKNKDNQVFYVQYCFARINSLFNTINISIDDNIKMDFTRMRINQYERKIIRKIFAWPRIIELASKKLEPHRVTFYLYELSTLFHSYWSLGNTNKDFRFIKDGKISSETTLAIIRLVLVVIRNGMNILNVSLPKKM